MEPFRPSRWLPGPHLQTLWGRFLRRGPCLAMRRETWETPDGDVLELDWVDGSAGSPLLLALHGLEGCSQSLYMHGLLHHARNRGWRGLALNFRSCASPPGRPRGEYVMNRTGRLYHMGETEDLHWVVARLVEQEPGMEILLAGVSLGGNVLLKWLGERGDDVPAAVRRAATISVPYDLAAASAKLERGLGPWYVRSFLPSLKAKAVAVADRAPVRLDLERVRTARTFRDIDDAAVAPLHGFADADDYYTRSSSLAFLDRIRVPCLLISAADDPFLPAGVLAEVRRRARPPVECLFTDRGGHAGFVEGPPWSARCWAEERAVEFLATDPGRSSGRVGARSLDRAPVE